MTRPKKMAPPTFRDCDSGVTIEELPTPRPCPFCGEADPGDIVAEPGDPPAFHVQCTGCLAEGPNAETQLAAALAWNAPRLRLLLAQRETNAIPEDLASIASLLRERQNKLYQVCAILRCAARSDDDDANSEADVLYAVEAAVGLLVPVADRIDFNSLRRDAEEVAHG